MTPKIQKKENQPRSQVRAKRRRTRNGCLTCRDRHLKCDENFPICNNCIKSKRECFRGIRLKFLNTHVHNMPISSFKGKMAGDAIFLDQSIVAASNYEDGAKSYAKYIHLHSNSDLKKAEIDFDKYLGVSISAEDPPSKRPKIKKSQDLKSNSANFRQLLDDFLKLGEFDTELAMSQDALMTKFNYFDPPTGLETYLGDVKVRKSRSRNASAETQGSNESSITDYYIFDSDEEQDNLTSPSTDYDDAFMEPLSDSKEVGLLSRCLEGCRWFLNGVSDNPSSDYWMNCVLSEKSFKDGSFLRYLLQSYGAAEKGFLGEPLGYMVSANEDSLKVAIESYTNKKFEDLKADPGFDDYIIAITLLIAGYFQRYIDDKSINDTLVSYIKLFDEVYIQSVPKNNTHIIASESLNACVMAVCAMDLIYSISSGAVPILDPFQMDFFLINKTTDFESKAVHESARQRFESSFEYNDIDDYETDESDMDDVDDYHVANNQGDTDETLSVSSSAVKPKLNEIRFTDASYLVTIMNILAKLNHSVKASGENFGTKGNDDWSAILDDLIKFENGLPYCFSPISIGPTKTQAVQGLATMGLSQHSSVNEYAADPPFPFIKFANEMGLLIHIIHHTIYLLSEKLSQKGTDSFINLSREFLKFRAILWYNEVIPQDEEEQSGEQLHMARRVVSYFLSCHKIQKHQSENIWLFYGWCFDIAKTFLPPEDIEELDRRLQVGS